MTTFNRPGYNLPIVPATPTLDRLRSGPLALPAHGTLRPGMLERVTASRSERVLMRQRDAAAVTVESAQIQAAVEVAVALTEDAKALRLKSDRVETTRAHSELEQKMQQDLEDANAADSHLIMELAEDSVIAEKRRIDRAGALAAAGQIAPDRQEVLTQLARECADTEIGDGLATRTKMRESREAILNRTLSRKT